MVLLESIPNYPRIVLVGLGKQDGESVGSNMRKGDSPFSSLFPSFYFFTSSSFLLPSPLCLSLFLLIVFMGIGASLGVTTLRDNGASHVGVDTSFGNLQGIFPLPPILLPLPSLCCNL